MEVSQPYNRSLPKKLPPPPIVPATYPLRETYDKAFQTLSGVEEDIALDFIDASFDLGDEDEDDKEAHGAQQREKDKETAPGFFEPKQPPEDMEIGENSKKKNMKKMNNS